MIGALGGCIPRPSPPPGTITLLDEDDPPPRTRANTPPSNFRISDLGCGPNFKGSRRILRRFTTGSKMRAPIGPLGILVFLPPEIRLLIYEFALVSQTSHWATFGPGSGVQTALLRTSKAINAEATKFLYGVQHVIVDGEPAEGYSRNLPNPKTLLKLEKVMLCLHYSTLNRADTELSIQRPDDLYVRAINASLQLRHSTHLRRLHISLLNTSVRKTSNKLQRSPEVMAKMQQILLPFAYFPVLDGGLDVGGYDSIAYTEMFDEMRAKYLRIAAEEMMEVQRAKAARKSGTESSEGENGEEVTRRSRAGRCGRGFEEFWGDCIQVALRT